MNYVEIEANITKNWNEKLRDTLEKKHLSQEELATELRKIDNNKTSQQLISRWTHVGEIDSQKDKKIGFPSFLNMYYTAKILGVDLGFLIGEIHCKTFEAEQVSNYIGLDESTVEAIRLLIKKPSFCGKYNFHKTKDILGMLIEANCFGDFIDSINVLDETFQISTEKKREDELNKKYGKRKVSQAAEFIGSPENAPEELKEIVFALENYIDISYDESLEQENKYAIARYNLQLAFNRLIDELYPE